MKKNIKFIAIITAVLISSGCGKEFLDKSPKAQLYGEQVTNSDGVEALLLGAYGILNGNVSGTWGNYASAPSQWIFGEVASDNAHKGSEAPDQTTINDIELFTPTAANEHLGTMWQVYYEGVNRTNTVLKILKADQEGAKTISANRAVEIQAESRMLRAHYYFYLWRVFKNIPWVDDSMTNDEVKLVKNDQDVIENIVNDMKFAVENLPVSKINGEKGRMDRKAAQAYLGKLYLYQKKHDLALPLFKDVIATSGDLVSMPFENNFNVEKEDGPEVVMASKHAINPNGSGDNANVGDMLSGLYGTSPVGCCGFFQPSIDLVNAYKVDADGLPYLDGSYTKTPYLSDLGLAGKAKEDYVVDKTLRFDPRLDYTVGRRGVPYLDYGIMPGDAWIRVPSYGGPFVGMKTMINEKQFDEHAASGENYVTGLDVNIIRLSDVYLMAAECAVEAGDLKGATDYVNAVRNRAAKLPPRKIGAVNAAVYEVKPYKTFANPDYARKAVQFERRLELALEGHRFFDLVRWGIAKERLEDYSQFEGSYLSAYKGLIFQPHNAYFPIPEVEIDRSDEVLEQHAEYR